MLMIMLLMLCIAGQSNRVAADGPSVVKPLSVDDSLSGYQLSWSDEFNEDKLDTDQWLYRTDSKHWSKQQPENVSMSNGLLHIALKKEEAGTMHYTGGGIISKRKFEYGYYECKFRTPQGAGWHTSFWAMGYNGTDTSGKDEDQEIDFCEQDSVKPEDYSAGVIAWGDKGKGFGRKYIHTGLKLADDFHTWGCEFTAAKTRFFFDGKLTHQTDGRFKQGLQQIWLTVIASHLGGTKAVDDFKLPAVVDYDYVRFFEQAGAVTQPVKPN